MRVLFVWFNFDCPVGFSHGLAVLSHELKAAGHSVGLLHLNEAMGTPWNPSSIAQTIHRKNPDIVGFSFGTNHAWAARELAAAVKRALPGAVLVCGGIHATIVPEEVAAWEGVDLAFAGEADDHRLAAIVESLGRGSVPVGAPGVWTLGRRGVRGNPMPPPVDLGAAPRRADLDLFDHRRILELKRGYADAISGRGCAYRCTYCHNQLLRSRYLRDLRCPRAGDLGYVRKRSVEDVIAELAGMRKRHGARIKVFSFTDDMFITGKRWFYEFLDAYRASFDQPLVFCSTVHQIDDEVARRAAGAGVYMVRLGVESGSPRIRREVLGRPGPNDTIRRAVGALRAAGVNVLTFNMLAIPGERMSDVWATFRFAADLRADAVQVSVFWPYPHTALYELCRSRGLLTDRVALRGNYLSVSPLSWPPGRARFYNRIRAFYAAALNRFLPGPGPTRFGAVLRDMAAMPEDEWAGGGAGALAAHARRLEKDVGRRGVALYTTPFPERPDILLLRDPERARPLINV
ncbi:MAG: B12-binding domain-containing radical SAM protein [Deltaproteobacteria bacterium]|nr:B12-binding domain-containing radical SAM protein [Deltaproteobacteria bacterium]